MRTLLVCFVFSLASLLSAQEPAAPAKKLTVLLKPAKPFAFGKADAPEGFSVDLWKRVALETRLDYEFKEVESVPALIDGLKTNQADVGCGALSITAERETFIDFSHPFYKSGLQIMINNTKASSPFRAFLKLDIFKILGVLLIAIVINTFILWYFERGKTDPSFPDDKPVVGILNAAWWSVSMLITLGCENIAPTRVAGRLLGIVWMLAGVALYSYVTATITSTMTVNTLQSDIKTVSDLHGEDVGTVKGSSSVDFLKGNEITAKEYPDVDAACRGRDQGRGLRRTAAQVLREHACQHQAPARGRPGGEAGLRLRVAGKEPAAQGDQPRPAQTHRGGLPRGTRQEVVCPGLIVVEPSGAPGPRQYWFGPGIC